MSYVEDARRFHRPDKQGYALQQARDRHTEVLFRRGEYALFILMWDVSDFERGLVGRCPTCVNVYSADTVNAFGGQPAKDNCIDCFGTGFEGGWKAQIVRPALWDSSVEPEQYEERRGTHQRQTLAVQSTFDFRLNKGDFIVRKDGTRWYARAPLKSGLSTGFGGTDALGFNHTAVTLEAPDSVAFLIPPSNGFILPMLQITGHDPVDFSVVEEIKPGAELT